MSHGVDVAIIDINLHAFEESIEGIHLAQQIRERWPDIRILLTTADSDPSGKLAHGDQIDLKVHGFIAKPFGVHRLRSELTKALSTTPALPTTFLPNRRIELAPQTIYSERTFRPIDRLVSEFKDRMCASEVLLCALHPISLVARLLAGNTPEHGSARGTWEEYWSRKLRYSPVRDVAIDGDTLLERDATSSEYFPKNRWLQRAYGYRSVVGVPVHAIGEEAYFLFAFQKAARAFTQEHIEVAEMYAIAIGALLEKERLLSVLESETRYVTSGITLNVLGHELRTTLGAAALNAEMIVEQVEKSTVSPAKLALNLREQCDAIARSVDICETFVEMAQQESSMDVLLIDCVRRAIRFASPRLKSLDTSVDFVGVDPKLHVFVDRVAFEQALFNLIVNAAEQIDRIGNRSGMVTIGARERQAGDKALVKMTIEDNGPGVHYCMWEKIFEPGYSTKVRGSGLGLHICRRALDRIGGSINVESSDLWIRTVFALLVPMPESAQ